MTILRQIRAMIPGNRPSHRLIDGSKPPIGTIQQVENPDTEPTIDPQNDPWDEVSSRFGELGHRLKSTYRKVADEEGPSDDEIKGAFATLAGAWDQIAESVSDILRDPETRDGLKRAAGSLASALGSTLSDLSSEFGTARGESGAADDSRVPDIPPGQGAVGGPADGVE